MRQLRVSGLRQTCSKSIHAAPAGLSLAELLVRHPAVARRTAQRWLGRAVADGSLVAQGEARARRYLADSSADTTAERFPVTIPLSADSHDILAYVDQPLQARKPVGSQRDFLDAYQPNVTWYLPAPLRRQLHNMGHTAQSDAPAGTYSRAILNRLLIDLSWASSQLEGNTYSRLDTRALIEHGQAAHGKAATETQMILDHKTAIELLVANVEGRVNAVGFDRYTLMNLHAALSENLLPNPADEGRIRGHMVEIGKSAFRRLSVPQQIDEALAVLLSKASLISDPFEQSFFMLVHLPYLQPFADINKRTTRLAYRDVIKKTIYAVVSNPGDDALKGIAQAVATSVPEPDRASVRSLIVEELRRLHEGVLARYGLRPSEFVAWKARAER